MLKLKDNGEKVTEGKPVKREPLINIVKADDMKLKYSEMRQKKILLFVDVTKTKVSVLFCPTRAC